MPYFYAPPENIKKDVIIFQDEESHHIKDVLRKKPGDSIWVTDGDDILVAWCEISGNNYGMYVESIDESMTVSYCNITSNKLHGILNEDPDTAINASYNWWGAPEAPEYSEVADDVDPEEIYGLFTNDTYTTYLEVPAGVVPVITIPINETVSLDEEVVTTEVSIETLTSTIAQVSPGMLTAISIVIGVVAALAVILVARRAAKPTE